MAKENQISKSEAEEGVKVLIIHPFSRNLVTEAVSDSDTLLSPGSE